MSPESPLYPTLIESVVENMSLANREEIIAKIKQTQQPNPQAQQQQEVQNQMLMAQEQAKLDYITAQTQEIQTRIEQNRVETELLPIEVQAKYAAALSNNLQAGDADDKEFERRAEVAKLRLKEREIISKEKIVEKQMRGK
jgi:hypothetical protein